MSVLKKIKINQLFLDLENYRTIQQKNEKIAIITMISISPDRFWSLMESLMDDGYYPTENIIVLDNNGKYIVKEGNRRVAALKIIHGLTSPIEIPENLREKINSLTVEWKKENSDFPCSVYQEKEASLVTKNIALIHAKGEKAGRDQWTAVAKARFNRDEKKQKEIGLDMLEKYLKNGKNVTPSQIERWSGDYPVTVVNEALPKLYSLLNLPSVDDVYSSYPKKNKIVIEKIMYDIGIQNLGFKELRDKNIHWGDKYGLFLVDQKNSPPQPTVLNTSQNGNQVNVSPMPNKSTPSSSTTNPSSSSNPVSIGLTDPKSVLKKIKSFKPHGENREKVVTLLDELKTLKVEQHPHSFCFLLRSLFEISAKIYATENKSKGCPDVVKSDGRDKTLADSLRDIVSFMTVNSTDKAKMKLLHGAITELGKPDGILSVTSMNQLVHNPHFSIQPNDICILFGNIFPLLEELNK